MGFIPPCSITDLIPSATSVVLVIPPKIFTRILSAFGSLLTSLTAASILSSSREPFSLLPREVELLRDGLNLRLRDALVRNLLHDPPPERLDVDTARLRGYYDKGPRSSVQCYREVHLCLVGDGDLNQDR